MNPTAQSTIRPPERAATESAMRPHRPTTLDPINHEQDTPMSAITSIQHVAHGRDGPPDGALAPQARCADGNGTMTGLFFSDHVVDIARAKAMCALCPLTDSCLAGALEREEPWGVWGGELLSGGRIVHDKRPCGRPPKHPRPVIVYDEMGPVGEALTVA